MMSRGVIRPAAGALLFGFVFASIFGCGFCYTRPSPRNTLSVPNDLPPNSPQQVYISLVGEDKMRVTWITDGDEDKDKDKDKDKDAPSIVDYGTTPGSYPFSANGTSSEYKYLIYTSGKIHQVVIGPLTPSTTYYYRCSSDSTREFSFKTPPSTFPIKFAVSGDLGQTEFTKSTLEHVANSNYHVFLLPGDLSYADFYQPLWDSFGRLIEPLSSTRPWMVTQGNHDIEKLPVLHSESFTSFNARYHMPYEQSGSESNLYYSFDVANVHVIALGSYTDFGSDSAQFKWLQSDLKKIDRVKTPWVIAMLHAPWYNTNDAHQNEKESVDMKKEMESLIYGARVDILFTGHVHAYERFDRVYNGKAERCGTVHITIGDGGNREGLAGSYMSPQPAISLFREASFGHGQLLVVNATQARWEWHRNDDEYSVVSDSLWLTSLSSEPACLVSIPGKTSGRYSANSNHRYPGTIRIVVACSNRHPHRV